MSKCICGENNDPTGYYEKSAIRKTMEQTDLCYSCAFVLDRYNEYEKPVIYKGQIYAQWTLNKKSFASGSYWGYVMDVHFADGTIQTMLISHPSKIPDHFNFEDNVTNLVLHYPPLIVDDLTVEEYWLPAYRPPVLRYIDGCAITEWDLKVKQFGSKLIGKGISITGWRNLIYKKD